MSCQSFLARWFCVSPFCVLLMISPVRAEEPTQQVVNLQTVKYQVTGLFSSGRAQDLRETVAKLDGVTLVSVDYNNAEAIFVFDPQQLFPNVKEPTQVFDQFHNYLGLASRRTFGVKPVCEVPRAQLKWIEIPVVGLDCKGCSLAAYEAIFKMEGVEQATASFKRGLVSAWIHPEQTNQAALEEALEQKKVKLNKQ